MDEVAQAPLQRGRSRGFILASLSLEHGVSHLYDQGFPVFMPVIAQSLGLSYTQVATLLSIRQVGSGLVSLGVGALVDILKSQWGMILTRVRHRLRPGGSFHQSRASNAPVLDLLTGLRPRWTCLPLRTLPSAHSDGKKQCRSLGVVLGALSVFLSYNETAINLFFRSRYLMSISFFVGISWAVWRFALLWFKR